MAGQIRGERQLFEVVRPERISASAAESCWYASVQERRAMAARPSSSVPLAVTLPVWSISLNPGQRLVPSQHDWSPKQGMIGRMVTYAHSTADRRWLTALRTDGDNAETVIAA